MRAIAGVLVVALALAGCTGEPDSARDDAGLPAADASAGGAPAADSAADHGHAVAEPGEGAMLLAIMQKLGADMAVLTHGIMTDDTALIARTAAAIADHTAIAPEELERIHGELEAEMAEFERIDEAVHEASVRLHDAAATGRIDAVLERLHEVQRGCVECHTRFRQRLLTNPAG